MKKFLMILCTLALCAALAFPFAGCGGNSNKDPSGQQPNTQTDGNTSGETGGGGNKNPDGNTQEGNGSTTTLPTSEQIVAAISAAAEEKEQNYDFTLNLAGNVSVGFVHSPNANANYECNYRYNTQSGNLKFKRVTSGALLYDATEYIYSAGDSRITVKMNDKSEVTKVAVEYKDSELKLINLPFTSLVNSLTKDEIENIAKVSDDNYTADLKLSSDNAALKAICKILGTIDSSISFKGVSVTNPVNGIDFIFSMANGKLTGYTLKAEISIPVKATSANLNLTYTQRTNNSLISIPNVAGLITDNTQISQKLATIKNALTDVKDNPAYSLDFEAVNEMDPGWNVTATKDSYNARLLKNTDSKGEIDFNHSYEFHSHHDEDGRETYKYIIGNTKDDGKTYLRSKKSKDTIELMENATADTQFDFITNYVLDTLTGVDCLKQITDGETTTYTIYLKDSKIVQTSKNIVALLNQNDAEGVVDTDNYFNDDDYTIKKSTLTVVMTGQTINSIKLDTEIKYNPLEGDYTENNIMLNNKIELNVNKNLDKAQDYKAPDKPDGILGGLKYQG